MRSLLKKDNLYLIQIIDKRDGTKSPAMVCTPLQLIKAATDFTDLDEEQKESKTQYYENALVDMLSDYEAVKNLEKDDVSFRDLILAIPIFTFENFKNLFSTEGSNNGS